MLRGTCPEGTCPERGQVLRVTRPERGPVLRTSPEGTRPERLQGPQCPDADEHRQDPERSPWDSGQGAGSKRLGGG